MPSVAYSMARWSGTRAWLFSQFLPPWRAEWEIQKQDSSNVGHLPKVQGCDGSSAVVKVWPTKAGRWKTSAPLHTGNKDSSLFGCASWNWYDFLWWKTASSEWGKVQLDLSCLYSKEGSKFGGLLVISSAELAECVVHSPVFWSDFVFISHFFVISFLLLSSGTPLRKSFKWLFCLVL